MVLNIKNFIFVLITLTGYYFFYIEFIKISNFNYSFKSNEISKVIVKNQKVDIENKDKIKLEYKESSKPILNKIEVVISSGDTFLSIINKFNVPENKVFEIVNEVQKFFNLKKIKVNDKILFYEDIENNLKKIEIEIDLDTLLSVVINEKIIVEKKELEKFLNYESKEFEILESLYTDGLKNNVPQEILMKIIKLFSFDLDFQRDIKKNTMVSVSYEYDQVFENNKIKYKDLNYAMISIEGKDLEYFKFFTDDGYIDYFNKEGKNVKKSILKTPLDGARLSSSFGMRKHPISGYNKMHKGVDFAAPMGTPIYAGGNGVVEYAGNNGGYGKYIRIRHNNEYKTAYAHLSGFKKGITKGVRVNQGEVIGFVGSTGNSTGPHLHYEIIFQNKQINPLKLKLPSGKILRGEELKRFKKEHKIIYANHLNLLYE